MTDLDLKIRKFFQIFLKTILKLCLCFLFIAFHFLALLTAPPSYDYLPGNSSLDDDIREEGSVSFEISATTSLKTLNSRKGNVFKISEKTFLVKCNIQIPLFA